MVVLGEGEPRDRLARALPDVLPADALVVVNDSQVVPARLFVTCTEGRADGRQFEILVCAPAPEMARGARFSAWVRGARRLRPGDRLVQGEFVVRYLGQLPEATAASGEGDLRDPRARWFEIEQGVLMTALEARGEVPLPPYIRRPEGPDTLDRARYQTLYARHPGSVAAPTAGLHWERSVLDKLDVAAVTLHVGPGTFLPMEAADVEDHRVGAERADLSEETVTRIQQAKAAGRPVVAVGTTATRALEAVATEFGALRAYRGAVDRIITPRHQWRVVDILVTNFHLPRSSLLMLVCSLGGRSRVLAAYRAAVARGYRFYSYGDCMVIDRRAC
jgi:S-adenosylmethionine:tRNA ribosyltransferase-isomerase